MLENTLVQQTDEALNIASNDILSAIRSNYFTAIIGDPESAHTKSVIKELKRVLKEGKTVGQDGTLWQIIDIQPGISPVSNLSTALAKPGVLVPKGEAKPNLPVVVDKILRSDRRGIIKLQKMAKIETGQPFNLLILVQLFDDIYDFTPENRAERQHLEEERINFLKLLLEASVLTNVPVYVGVSVSMDMVSKNSKNREFIKAVQEGSYYLKKLTLKDYLKKIDRKFGNQSVDFNNLITKDLSAEKSIDALDFKWHFLTTKFSEISADKYYEQYQNWNGLKGIINSVADEEFEKLNTEEQNIIEQIFKVCVQRNKEKFSGKTVKLSHLLEISESKSDTAKIAFVDAIRKFQNAGLLKMVEPSAKVQNIIPYPERTLIVPANDLILNEWKRAIDWAKEDALWGLNYQRIVNHAIMNKGKVTQKNLLSDANIENGKVLFEDPGINETWAKEHFNKEKIDESWAEGFQSTLDLAKKYWKKSEQKRDSLLEVEQTKQKKMTRLYKRSAIFGGSLAIMSLVFLIVSLRMYRNISLEKENLNQQNFMTVLDEANLIDINFDQRIKVLKDNNINSLSKVLSFLKEDKIIKEIPLKEATKAPFFSVNNLYKALLKNNEKERKEAIIQETKELLKIQNSRDNHYLYYALNIFHNQLRKMNGLPDHSHLTLEKGSRAMASNPNNKNQFAVADKFGGITIISRNILRDDDEEVNSIRGKINLPPTEQANALAFSEDGINLYAGTTTGKIYKWEVSKIDAGESGIEIDDKKEKIYHLRVVGTNQHIFGTTKYKIFGPHNILNTQKTDRHRLGEINDFVISPDKKYLLVGGAQKTLVFDLIENNSHIKIGCTVLKHPKFINTAMAIGEGNQVAIGTHSGKLFVFNLDNLLYDDLSEITLEDTYEMNIEFQKEFTDLDFVDKGNQTYLASSSIDGLVTLFNITESTNNPTSLELRGHDGAVWETIFNNSHELMSMESDQIRFWETSVEDLKDKIEGLID